MTRIRITPDGTVRGLWTEAVDWRSLGRLAVQRASHVEFSPGKQMWFVRPSQPRSVLRAVLQAILLRPFGEILHWANSREEALAWERRYYEPGGRGWDADHGAYCDGCDGSGVRSPATPPCSFRPGEIAGWTLVERCDACDCYPDDLAAAEAVFEETKWVTCIGGGTHAVGRRGRSRALRPACQKGAI